MAREPSDTLLRPTLIDRLTRKPGDRERLFFEGIGVRELKMEVGRDLEWLLNTRMWIPPSDDELSELEETRNSLITYGIPDLSIFSWANPQDCQRIARMVETAVRTFEPRLLPQSVRCEIVPTTDETDFSLKLRIEAILHVEPISEHVAFDSSAEFDGGGIRIESFE